MNTYSVHFLIHTENGKITNHKMAVIAKDSNAAGDAIFDLYEGTNVVVAVGLVEAIALGELF